jgi:hypothetical protein
MNCRKQNERILMLKLAEIENEKLAEIKLIQLAQDAMLPEFEAAADLLRLELAPFVKYGRVPFVDVSAKSELIHIRVTVQKTSAKSVSFIWLNESYRVTPSGGLFDNVMIGMFGGVDIVTDPYTNGSTGVVNIYAYQMADVAVAHAGAFQKVTLTA